MSNMRVMANPTTSGFQVTFDNGYQVSAMNSPGNYVSGRKMLSVAHGYVESSNVEVCVFKAGSNKPVPFSTFGLGDMQGLSSDGVTYGWCRALDLARIMAAVAAYDLAQG